MFLFGYIDIVGDVGVLLEVGEFDGKILGVGIGVGGLRGSC